MARTIITISDTIKEWLENYSHMNHQSIAETIRNAIEEYKTKVENGGIDEIIIKTSGIWKDRKINGLDYVNKLREEWD